MKFLITMTNDEGASFSEAEQERIGALHDEFQRKLGDRYVCCYGAAPSGEAQTVRLHDDGHYSVVSGLATQTKEPLGGFYIIEAESMEEAVEWAKQGRFLPGPNEVREIFD